VLSGSDTLAHYQSVLDKVTLAAGENPNNFGSNPTRTVTWLLDDGSGRLSSYASVCRWLANSSFQPIISDA
jgi:hypothetical protein